MEIKICILQEVSNQESFDSEGAAFTAYKINYDHLGYQNYVGHNANDLLRIMETITPDIVIWIYPRSDKMADLLWKYRRENHHLKVIWMDDYYGRVVGDSSRYYDHLFVPILIHTHYLQKIITEWLLDSLEDDLNNQTKRILIQLSDNALHTVASEQLWRNEKADMKSFLKLDKQGRLDQNDRNALLDSGEIIARDNQLNLKNTISSCYLQLSEAGLKNESVRC